MKKLTIRMNRIYPVNEIELSETRFKHYHEFHIIIKRLRIDFHPKNNERTILILSEGVGDLLRSIQLIPFDYILIVDPNYNDYKCIVIEGKKVIKIGLPHLILIQIIQSIGVRIDAVFLPMYNCEKVDFFLEMLYPIMSDEFILISNRTSDNEYLLNYYEGILENLPYVFTYPIEIEEYEHLYFFGLAIKQTQQTQYIRFGTTIHLVYGSLWSHIDSDIEVVFTQFPDSLSEYQLSLYENDLFSIDGKYKSADNEIFNLKKNDALEAMVAKCGFESVGFTLFPRVWEQVERIIKSENAVRDIYVFGFFYNPNDQIPAFIRKQNKLM